ncbi:hypothetical protein GOODEAATRI_033932, partial [Goodea atripinnis]
QQIQHYTNQLAKETNKHLKEFGSVPLPSSPSEQASVCVYQTRMILISFFFCPFPLF